MVCIITQYIFFIRISFSICFRFNFSFNCTFITNYITMFLIFCFNWKTTSTVCVLYSFWSTFTLALISSSTLYSSSTTNSLTTAPPTTMVSVSNRLLILMFCYCIYLQVPFLSYPLLLYTIVVHQEKTCLPTAACMGRMVGMTRRDSRGRDNEVSEESSPSTCW